MITITAVPRGGGINVYAIAGQPNRAIVMLVRLGDIVVLHQATMLWHEAMAVGVQKVRGP